MKRTLLALLLVTACSKSKEEPKPQPKAAEPKAEVKQPGPLAVKISASSIEPSDFRSMLREPGHPTSGTVSLADDARFEQLVAVLDTAHAAGTELAVVLPEPIATNVPLGAMDPEHAVIVLVSPTELSIMVDKVAKPIALGEGQEIPELAAAFDALKPAPTTLVIQADKATTGATLNRVLRTASHLGNPATLFAYKDPQ